MRPGLFSAAAGMIDSARRMDTIVHNLANVNTTAYKRHRAISVPFTRFLDENLDDIEGAGGEILAQQHIRYDLCNGTLKYTERPLDVALQDTVFEKGTSCAFFSVRVPPRVVTRPKQYLVDPQGYLVEARGVDGREFGPPAQDIEGNPVKLPEGTGPDDVYIDPDGFVYVGDVIHAQLRDHEIEATLDPGVQYTRKGAFHLQIQGDASYLVTAEGFRVQGKNGDIKFDATATSRNIQIDRQGRIYIKDPNTGKNKEIDQLKISYMRDIPFDGELKFRLDEQNYVVNARGQAITDIEGRFIIAPVGTTDIDVTPDGRVLADGNLIAYTLERPGRIKRGEDEPLLTQTKFGYYIPADEFVEVVDVQAQGAAPRTELHQYYLEQSNVNVVSELGQMIITMRTFEANARLLQAVEQNLQKVTNAPPA